MITNSKDYIVITTATVPLLEAAVLGYMGQNYRCLGGAVISGTSLCQTMYREG